MVKVLGSLEEICEFMRASRETVRGWVENGAPIAVEQKGKRPRYRAEAGALWDWLLARRRGLAE